MKLTRLTSLTAALALLPLGGAGCSTAGQRAEVASRDRRDVSSPTVQSAEAGQDGRTVGQAGTPVTR